MRLKNLNLTLSYDEDLRLFRSRQSRLMLLVGLIALVAIPLSLTSNLWLSILNYAGIAAIGAIGLNLLTGYTGQVSLGHGFFLGTGAYTAVFLGSKHHLPMPVWIVGAALVGAAIGAVVGPFALRLRGNYLAIVSLGLILVGLHVFSNWDSLTGGPGGTSIDAPAKLPGVDFANLSIGQTQYTRNQGFCLLIWLVVALTAVLAKNLVRSRPGRAMQAVRDRDLAAEVIGVSTARYKIGAFIVSSALAAAAGALFAVYQRFVLPGDWTVYLSIQYLAIIIVGGIGTIFGAIIGALFIGAVPQLINHYSSSIPFVAASGGNGGGFHLSVFQLNQVIFGLLIILFLILEPRGLAAIWLRIKAYFKSWPFSY
jgi:branched-chain amino acid transport system permease protein